MMVFPLFGCLPTSRFLYLFFVAFFCGLKFADGQTVNEFGNFEIERLDSLVVQGRLVNGFSYFIRNNDAPRDRIELRLVVKAGRNFETKKQVEYAHLIEHLVFEGTMIFPGDSARRFLAANGLRMGPEVNASTSGDYTIFEISLPAKNDSLLAGCMRVLHDWSVNGLFTRENVAAQSGVVMSEISKADSDPDARSLWRANELLFGDNKFSTQALARRKESLRHVSLGRLKKFYGDWYLPCNEGLIIVGNLDVVVARELISRTFSDYSRRPKCLQSVNRSVRSTTRINSDFLTVCDPGLSKTSAEVFFLINGFGSDIERDNKRSALVAFSNLLLGQRLSNVCAGQSYRLTGLIQGDIFETGVGGLNFKCKDMSSWAMRSELKSLLVEIERLKRYGFSENEIQKGKDSFRKAHQDDRAELSVVIAEKLVNYFVFDAAAPNPDRVKALLMESVEDLSVSEINDFLSNLLLDGERRILLRGPENICRIALNEVDMKSLLKKVAADTLAPVVEVEGLSYRLNDYVSILCPPASNGVLGIDSAWSMPNIRKWRLSNGANIYVSIDTTREISRRTSGINFLAYSRGGAALYQSSTDRRLARDAPSMVLNSDVGPLKNADFQRLLTNNKVRLSFSVGFEFEKITASCGESELELLLQLIFLLFKEPSVDKSVFRSWFVKSKFQFSERQLDSWSDMLDMRDSQCVNGVVGDSVSNSVDYVEKLFMERFSGISDFDFYLSGAKDLVSLRYFLERYIGCLDVGRKDKLFYKSGECVKQNSPYRHITYDDTGSLARIAVQLPFWQGTQLSLRDDLLLRVCTGILEELVVERLRTRGGLVYSPYVGLRSESMGCDSTMYRIDIISSCDAGHYDEVTKLILAEFDTLKLFNFSSGMFDRAIAKTRTMVTEGSGSSTLIDVMLAFSECGRQPLNIRELDVMLSSLSIEDIRITICKYIRNANVQQSIILPGDLKKQDP